MAWSFTASHGVTFTDAHGDTWAQFTEDRTLRYFEGSGEIKGYRFTTNDPQIAARLRTVREYGIREDTGGDGPDLAAA